MNIPNIFPLGIAAGIDQMIPGQKPAAKPAIKICLEGKSEELQEQPLNKFLAGDEMTCDCFSEFLNLHHI